MAGRLISYSVPLNIILSIVNPQVGSVSSTFIVALYRRFKCSLFGIPPMYIFPEFKPTSLNAN